MGFIFGGNTGVSYQELQRRRAIAEARAKQARGFPKTIGEGIYSLGTDIGETLADRSLTEKERQYARQYGAAANAAGVPITPPPAAGAAMTPPASVSSYAPNEPARDFIAAALVNQGNVPGGPRPEEAGDENPIMGADTSAPGLGNVPGRYQALVAQAEADYGLPKGLLPRLLKQESGFNPGAVSPAGAQGIAQLMPATARELGVTNSFDPRQAIPAAARYLRQGLDAYGNDPRLAAAYYHGGPDTAQWGPKTRAYADAVGGGGSPLRGGGRLALASTGVTSDALPILPRVPGGADEAPEPTPTDIQPSPLSMRAQIAQAPPPGGIGRMPGAFDPRVPEPPAPPSGMRPAERVMRADRPKPTPPIMDTKLTNEEIRGWTLMRQFPGDPNAQRDGQLLMGLGAAKRKAAYDREKEIFDKDIAAWHTGQESERVYERERALKDFELSEKRQKVAQAEQDRADFPLGIEKHAAIVKDSYEGVKNIPKAQAAISNVRALLDSDAGMFTGSTANIKMSLAKWAQAVGAPFDPRASNTETFRGLIVPILAALRPTIVGPGAQSLPELKMLQDAAAGNVTLERRTIENILGAIEKQGVQDAVNHQRIVIANSGSGPRADNLRQVYSSSYPLPMEKLVPRGAVELLRKKVAENPDKAAAEIEEFNKDYYTPGLAERLLGR